MIDTKLPVFEKKRTVTASEIDDLNHVNNVVYVQWAADVASEHWQTVGTPEMLENYGWIMLKHCIEYKKAAVLGDEILLRTQVGRATNVRYQRFIEIYNASSMDLLAKTTSDWCAIDKTGKPVKISQEIRDLFETL
ncbi:acyl-CoA thioester hydrolase [Nonlabens dokdonensis]|uniref:Thioesterase superfamily protein n=2 Tax=Nonlabens dokdonensis TaxID=328515 RepID=L7W7F8_NONDD|nr:thioesterase family protein [Nonlabens dokdonensis]AGC77625.1 thioesterase superfamily protein [Nonlabens dokdonensis DSW-6]PZX39828.1 acyl-CoA thioester hydrolase [Nonlabens dokdonensis]